VDKKVEVLLLVMWIAVVGILEQRGKGWVERRRDLNTLW
jgi:hypothetical protein